MLDSFLSDHNSEAIVKDAIRLAKPYFFETVVRGLLEREAVRVFDSFKAEATSNEVMLYYMFNHEYPHARLSPIMRKLTTFNEERDRDQYISAIFPDLSDSYAVKAYTSMMGHGTPTDNAALLEDATRRQYQELKDLKKQI